MNARKPKPPLGVEPDYIWSSKHPEPGLQELLERYEAVLAAVVRYRKAGLAPLETWRIELGVAVHQTMYWNDYGGR
jgi:hypothetical protein